MAKHGDIDQQITVFPGQAPHTFALGTHYQSDRAGKIRLIQGIVRLAGGANEPDAIIPDRTHKPRKIGDTYQRYGFSRTTGHFPDGRRQRRRLILGHDHSLDTHGISGSQTGAQVMGIGNPIQNQQKRRLIRP